MYELHEVLASMLLLIGGFFTLIGAFGMVKLPDLYTRLHAPTKSTTLGIGCVLLASITLHAYRGGGFAIQELVISVFLFITAPVAAYMIAKAALHQRIPMVKHTKNTHLVKDILQRRAPSDENPNSEH